MIVRCTVFTHRGVERPNNEDGILAAGWLRNSPMEEPAQFTTSSAVSVVFAVADGLGGHASGEVASQYALARIEALLGGRTEIDEQFVKQTLSLVHRELVDLSKAAPAYHGMGTTVAGLLLNSDDVMIFHVGDSRVYRKEEKFLQLLTEDDRLSERKYGDSASQGTGNALLQCLGAQTDYSEITPHVQIMPRSSKPETFLLCTDGLFDLVALDEMEASISGQYDTRVKSLFDKACAGGGRDNVTIVIVETTPQAKNDAEVTGPSGKSNEQADPN
jgi:serine/threonine protein phosphatase PrpC